MSSLPRVALVASLAVSSWPAMALGQATSMDSLVGRVELLELTVSELADRVRQLESLVGSEPSQSRSLPATAKWRDLQNWRRLKRGMKMDEVRALLGEPERVDTLGRLATYWRWEYRANVEFDERGKVRGWSEP